jgi:hypothetical protein
VTREFAVGETKQPGKPSHREIKVAGSPTSRRVQMLVRQIERLIFATINEYYRTDFLIVKNEKRKEIARNLFTDGSHGL